MGHVTQDTVDLIRKQIEAGKTPSLNPAEFLELAKFWEDGQKASQAIIGEVALVSTLPPPMPFTQAVMNSVKSTACRLYMSDRDIPLIYVDSPLDVPIITLENYIKWYSVFVILPSGEVQKVPVQKIEEANESGSWVADHCFHPKLLYRLAKMYGGSVDSQAVEIAIGRWIEEINGHSDFGPEKSDA